MKTTDPEPGRGELIVLLAAAILLPALAICGVIAAWLVRQ